MDAIISQLNLDDYKINEKESTVDRLVLNRKAAELKEGEDYKYIDLLGRDYYIIIDRSGHSGNCGFNYYGHFRSNMTFFCENSWVKATEEEVKAAFTKELNRRYGSNWENIKINYLKLDLYYPDINSNIYTPVIIKTEEGWQVWNKNGCLYFNGVWADKLDEKPKSKDLEIIEYINSNPKITGILSTYTKAFLAFMQLISLRDKYNEGYLNDKNECFIGFIDNIPTIIPKYFNYGEKRILYFANTEIAQKFLNDFKELIIEASPLL